MTEGSGTTATREVSCPLCGYETILFDDETTYCPHCFTPGSRPAQPLLQATLALAETPPTHPVTDTIKLAIEKVRQADPGEAQIGAGDRVKRAVIEEATQFTRAPLNMTEDDAISISGVPIATAHQLNPQTARVWPDRGKSQVSARQLGDTILAAEVIDFPEVLLGDG